MANTAYRVLDAQYGLGFLPPACALVRVGAGVCTACQTACPADAIEVSDTGVQLANRCLGCGRCVGACPTGALNLRGLAVEWPLPNGDEVIAVECAKVPPAQRAASARVVPCLGCLSPARLLELVVENPQHPVQLVGHGWCQNCGAGRGLDAVLTDRLENVRQLLSEAGWPQARLPARREQPLPLAHMSAELSSPADSEKVDRRRFLGRLAGQAVQVVATSHPQEAPAPVRSVVRREDGVFPERVRWVHAVARLVQATGCPIPERAFPALRVVRECRDHGVCAAVCPTGALRRYQTGTHVGLEFTAAWCIRCDLCTRHCPGQALALDASAAVAAHPLAPVTVTLHPRQVCPECGTAVNAEGLCPLCQKSKSLMRELFGSAAAGDCSGIP
jgi:Fe-S-cluster-containing hydrogenase component 2